MHTDLSPFPINTVAQSQFDDGVTAEAAAHALLRMVGDLPGQMGRLRAARVVGGYSLPGADENPELVAQLAPYAVAVQWPLRETVRLIDALIDGGLVARTAGPRPVLMLTRAGHRALDALEAHR